MRLRVGRWIESGALSFLPLPSRGGARLRSRRLRWRPSRAIRRGAPRRSRRASEMRLPARAGPSSPRGGSPARCPPPPAQSPLRAGAEGLRPRPAAQSRAPKQHVFAAGVLFHTASVGEQLVCSLISPKPMTVRTNRRAETSSAPAPSIRASSTGHARRRVALRCRVVEASQRPCPTACAGPSAAHRTSARERDASLPGTGRFMCDAKKQRHAARHTHRTLRGPRRQGGPRSSPPLRQRLHRRPKSVFPPRRSLDARDPSLAAAAAAAPSG